MQWARQIEWFLIAAVWSIFASGSFAQAPPAKQKTSNAGENIAETLTIGLFNTLLFFDHVFMRPATAISPDYLQRISKPSSNHYRDYVEYRSGRIDRAELVRRLPHIAMIGDSLSKNFYISSPASMLWRARTERQRDWFLDTDASPQSINSLYERLARVTPLVATEYSTSGAVVAPTSAEPFTRRLARTRYFQDQVAQIKKARRFPDVILIWIGHNNTNWADGLSETERKNPAPHLQSIVKKFRADYTEGLTELVDEARKQDHRVALVVFGLADFETFFQMREKAANLHASNPELFPYYPATCRYFEALKLENREVTTRLGQMLNTELKDIVAAFNRNSKIDSNVRLEYSDALSKIDLHDVRGFNRNDAWHPSIIGHNVLAYTAFKAVRPSLRFIGIDGKSDRATRDRFAQKLAR